MTNAFLSEWKSLFAEHRPFLMGYAFRLTGSLAESEALVQDVFSACGAVHPSELLNVRIWLTKVCSNKALEHLKISYKTRETYPGTWLPDAVPDSYQLWDHLSGVLAADKSLVLAESMTTTFLLLVERLTPEERVVYLLKEILNYPYPEIGEFLNKTEATCRKIAQRARESIAANQTKFAPNVQSSDLIMKFFDAARGGDVAVMKSLLATGSEFWSDGGGKVTAARGILKDQDIIAKFFAGLASTFTPESFKVEPHAVNSRAGMIISKKVEGGDWKFDTIMTFETGSGQIARIYAQRSPDKLQSLAI